MNQKNGGEPMKGDDLAARLLDYAARVLKLCDTLPNSQSGKHIAIQLVRSATSAGANYEEARGAESEKDFIHKLGISLKEMRESRYWLQLVARAELVKEGKAGALTQESEELCRILGRSILTTKGRIHGEQING